MHSGKQQIGTRPAPHLNTRRLSSFLAGAFVAAGLALPRLACGHCDTMDGPVIQAAKAALDQNNIVPVLKWVKPDGEAEVKTAFAKTLVVRTQSPEARELADRYFFETLVRVHRTGEGASFTGLKPAGTETEPGILAADKALESGTPEQLAKLVSEAAVAGIRQRFAEVREKKRHADESVEAGREFVAAYVDYVHYIERLHESIQGHADAHAGGQALSLAREPHAATPAPHSH